MRSNHNTNIQTTQSNSLRAVLARLDSYMDAAPYGVEHPWRVEIAAALAAPADVDLAIDHLEEALEIACVARSFVVDNIGPVMNAISALADSNEADPKDNGRQLSLIRKLARLGNQLVDEAAADMEAHQDAMQGKLDALGELA